MPSEGRLMIILAYILGYFFIGAAMVYFFSKYTLFFRCGLEYCEVEMYYVYLMFFLWPVWVPLSIGGIIAYRLEKTKMSKLKNYLEELRNKED